MTACQKSRKSKAVLKCLIKGRKSDSVEIHVHIAHGVHDLGCEHRTIEPSLCYSRF